MPLEVWRKLDLRSSGFEIEPEITAKLLKNGYRIFEVPISYAARSRAEGKKLTYRDGVRALWTLARIRVAQTPTRPAENGKVAAPAKDLPTHEPVAAHTKTPR
jgi:hypothetical protein